MNERVKKQVLFNFQLEKLNLTLNNVLGGQSNRSDYPTLGIQLDMRSHENEINIFFILKFRALCDIQN
jgi:hypothetical protein